MVIPDIVTYLLGVGSHGVKEKHARAQRRAVR